MTPHISAGFTLWLTGPPAAGKSTLAHALRDELLTRGRRVEILDGDDMRAAMSSDLGYTKADRDANVHRIGFVARLLSRNGIAVVAAVVSPYRQPREQLRSEHEAPFLEIYVSCPLDVLVQRDPRGLYRRALLNEIPHFTGISDPYEEPERPDVVVRTDRETVEESVASIVAELERRDLVSRPASA